MWPFSFRRALKNRWWTLAFAVFVCWQAYDYAGTADAGDGNAALSNADAKAVTDALNAM